MKAFVHFQTKGIQIQVNDLNDILALISKADCFSQLWPVLTFCGWVREFTATVSIT